MQASFIGFKRSETEVLLVCSRDLLAPTLKRLSMFVMRAKARLSDATADYAAVRSGRRSYYNSVAGGAQPAWTKADFDQIGNVVHCRLPAASPAPCGWPRLRHSPQPARRCCCPKALWAWGEVQSGVATLTAPLVDAFVPQMLNYESVDGVSFKKGCYPGQEVVARSQFRGAIKRRAFIAHADGPLQAGDEVFSAAEPEQACGVVAQAAPAPEGGWDAIVVLQLAAAESGALNAGSAGGPALYLGTLPYTLKEDL
jgi:folate-binding protein YgfZ